LTKKTKNMLDKLLNQLSMFFASSRLNVAKIRKKQTLKTLSILWSGSNLTIKLGQATYNGDYLLQGRVGKTFGN